jgi:hypothetical protein
MRAYNDSLKDIRFCSDDVLLKYNPRSRQAISSLENLTVETPNQPLLVDKLNAQLKVNPSL